MPDQLDARKEYDAMRAAHGMQPHDPASATDIEMLDFFVAGTVLGIRHALLSVRERGVEVKR